MRNFLAFNIAINYVSYTYFEKLFLKLKHKYSVVRK